MNKEFLIFLNKVEGLKTTIKNLHWSASNTNEHVLCDDLADELSEMEDEISETIQGLYGQLNNNVLHPTQFNIKTTKEFIDTLLSTIKTYYKTIQGDEFIGLRSVVESYIQTFEHFYYLLNLALNENKRTGKKIIITEGQIEDLLKMSVKLMN